MKHRWFKDVNWNSVLNKKIRPPLTPDINTSYFQNEHDDSQDSVCNISSIRPSVNVSRSNHRRQSYYIQSTIQLQSHMDECNSFIRTGAQTRQLLDSSAIYSMINESVLLQNLQTSIIDSKNLVNGSQLQRHILQSNAHQQALNASNINIDSSRVQDQASEFDMNPQITEALKNFNYSSPPLAETQILRHLESHINRKKKDQLDKARRFREQFLSRKMEGNRRFKEDYNRSMAQQYKEKMPVAPLKDLIAKNLIGGSHKFS